MSEPPDCVECDVPIQGDLEIDGAYVRHADKGLCSDYQKVKRWRDKDEHIAELKNEVERLAPVLAVVDEVLADGDFQGEMSYCAWDECERDLDCLYHRLKDARARSVGSGQH